MDYTPISDNAANIDSTEEKVRDELRSGKRLLRDSDPSLSPATWLAACRNDVHAFHQVPRAQQTLVQAAMQMISAALAGIDTMEDMLRTQPCVRAAVEKISGIPHPTPADEAATAAAYRQVFLLAANEAPHEVSKRVNQCHRLVNFFGVEAERTMGLSATQAQAAEINPPQASLHSPMSSKPAIEDDAALLAALQRRASAAFLDGEDALAHALRAAAGSLKSQAPTRPPGQSTRSASTSQL